MADPWFDECALSVLDLIKAYAPKTANLRPVVRHDNFLWPAFMLLPTHRGSNFLGQGSLTRE